MSSGWYAVIAILAFIHLTVTCILAGTIEDRRYIFAKTIFWPLMPFVNLYQIYIERKQKKQKLKNIENNKRFMIEQMIKNKSVDELAEFYTKIGKNI